ncbi:tetratricopeptide repeat protein [Embleya sp. NPDC056575]|uniref:tetratricopeptide repeat protein n=1 Tax=unclassified Embleya TaxID=2699296 RepID=UPI0036A7C4E4
MSFRKVGRGLDRRAFLQRAGAVAAVGAALPLLGSAPSALAAADDPDQLFRQGRFADAERGYRRLLRDDPGNANAHAGIGYIALLSNRFRTAEGHLSQALALAPDDVSSTQRLAECFVRQDQLSRAVPLMRRTGRPRDEAFAEAYSRIDGTPWQITGARDTRVPFHTLDPVPSVEARVNGGEPQKFYLDTYGTLDLSTEAAHTAGLRALATWEGGVVDGHPVVIHVGVLDSFTIGEIEIRNIPVQWNDTPRPPLPDGSQAAGVFGTTIFYHFLTTMDYAHRALLLRRRTVARPSPDELARLPLWLAGDHFPCTLGSLGQREPRMVTVDTGGIASALDTTVAIAERYGLTVDHAHPRERFGIKFYPITADRIGLGGAVRRNVQGMGAEKVFPGFPGPGQSAQFGFDLIANFTHEFFKPYAVSFDYVGMKLSITRG